MYFVMAEIVFLPPDIQDCGDNAPMVQASNFLIYNSFIILNLDNHETYTIRSRTAGSPVG